VSNVLSEEKKQQVIALGRLGWSLRRIQQATHIRRETTAGYLSPRMLAQLVDDFRSGIKSANHVPRFDTLTTREREVIKMLAEGNSVKEIAVDLNLSVKTVEAHKFKRRSLARTSTFFIRRTGIRSIRVFALSSS
jgi:DNA-binding NarL/FixJ family response regulator